MLLSATERTSDNQCVGSGYHTAFIAELLAVRINQIEI